MYMTCIIVTRQQPTTVMFVQIQMYMYKFSSFDWDHFQINFSACLFSLLPKRFCFEVTECCVCYCNIITSVPFSGLTCWVIPAFILSPHRHASEMSSNSSLGEMPTQQAVVQSFLKNYDKVCSLWYMKENECSIYISITCICNDTLIKCRNICLVEIFAKIAYIYTGIKQKGSLLKKGLWHIMYYFLNSWPLEKLIIPSVLFDYISKIHIMLPYANFHHYTLCCSNI